MRSEPVPLSWTPIIAQNARRSARWQPGVPLTDDERAELRLLRKEVRELRMEREISKEATAFFAKQSE